MKFIEIPTQDQDRLVLKRLSNQSSFDPQKFKFPTFFSGVPPAPAAGGPPPPPPPPPANLFDDLKIDENAEDKARNALFAELNKGEGVTSGLKKVTDDMKTHKNPGNIYITIQNFLKIYYEYLYFTLI